VERRSVSATHHLARSALECVREAPLWWESSVRSIGQCSLWHAALRFPAFPHPAGSTPGLAVDQVSTRSQHHFPKRCFAHALIVASRKVAYGRAGYEVVGSLAVTRRFHDLLSVPWAGWCVRGSGTRRSRSLGLWRCVGSKGTPSKQFRYHALQGKRPSTKGEVRMRSCASGFRWTEGVRSGIAM
jgi:hypothetical protein